jgi:hypothetical protein
MPPKLDRAVRDGVLHLQGTQDPRGFWSAPGDMGPLPTAQTLVALRYAGAAPPVAADLARWLAGQQRPDGGFVAWPFADASDLGATAVAWAALSGTPHVAAADAAGRYVTERGGVDAVLRRFPDGDTAAIFLAMSGLVPPASLRSPPVIGMLLPPFEGVLGRRVHAGIPIGASVWRALCLRHGRASRLAAVARVERRLVLELLAEYQNRNGSFNETVFQTTLLVGGLVALGADDDRRARAVDWLVGVAVRDGDDVWMPGFHLPIWSTVFDVRALLRAGVPAADPTLRRAADWLCDAQYTDDQAPRNRRRRGAPNVTRGGWGFTPTNERMPDCDDAGAVLSALGPLLADETDPERRRRLRDAIDRGVAWLVGMQNDDGGFASYTTGLPPKPPGPILTEPARLPRATPRGVLELLLRPPLALGDPSTEDVTGRVLDGLGHAGLGVGHPTVDRAVAFLRAQQGAPGWWWGRWMLNYLAATSFILMGLAAVGVRPDDPMAARAIAWVRSRQNPDGSWGETTASYRDPEKAGVGPGSAPLTGLVICGLAASGLATAPDVERAAAWLVQRRLPGSGWPDDGYLTPLLLPDSFYFHGEAARSYPLEAIARVRAALRRRAD